MKTLPLLVLSFGLALPLWAEPLVVPVGSYAPLAQKSGFAELDKIVADVMGDAKNNATPLFAAQSNTAVALQKLNDELAKNPNDARKLATRALLWSSLPEVLQPPAFAGSLRPLDALTDAASVNADADIAAALKLAPRDGRVAALCAAALQRGAAARIQKQSYLSRIALSLRGTKATDADLEKMVWAPQRELESRIEAILKPACDDENAEALGARAWFHFKGALSNRANRAELEKSIALDAQNAPGNFQAQASLLAIRALGGKNDGAAFLEESKKAPSEAKVALFMAARSLLPLLDSERDAVESLAAIGAKIPTTAPSPEEKLVLWTLDGKKPIETLEPWIYDTLPTLDAPPYNLEIERMARELRGEKVPESPPLVPLLLHRLSVYYGQKGDFENAFKARRAALNRSGFASDYAELGDLAFRQGQFKKAADLYDTYELFVYNGAQGHPLRLQQGFVRALAGEITPAQERDYLAATWFYAEPILQAHKQLVDWQLAKTPANATLQKASENLAARLRGDKTPASFLLSDDRANYDAEFYEAATFRLFAPQAGGKTLVAQVLPRQKSAETRDSLLEAGANLSDPLGKRPLSLVFPETIPLATFNLGFEKGKIFNDTVLVVAPLEAAKADDALYQRWAMTPSKGAREVKMQSEILAKDPKNALALARRARAWRGVTLVNHDEVADGPNSRKIKALRDADIQAALQIAPDDPEVARLAYEVAPIFEWRLTSTGVPNEFQNADLALQRAQKAGYEAADSLRQINGCKLILANASSNFTNAQPILERLVAMMGANGARLQKQNAPLTEEIALWTLAAQRAFAERDREKFAPQITQLDAQIQEFARVNPQVVQAQAGEIADILTYLVLPGDSPFRKMANDWAARGGDNPRALWMKYRLNREAPEAYDWLKNAAFDLKETDRDAAPALLTLAELARKKGDTTTLYRALDKALYLGAHTENWFELARLFNEIGDFGRAFQANQVALQLKLWDDLAADEPRDGEAVPGMGRIPRRASMILDTAALLARVGASEQWLQKTPDGSAKFTLFTAPNFVERVKADKPFFRGFIARSINQWKSAKDQKSAKGQTQMELFLKAFGVSDPANWKGD